MKININLINTIKKIYSRILLIGINLSTHIDYQYIKKITKRYKLLSTFFSIRINNYLFFPSQLISKALVSRESIYEFKETIIALLKNTSEDESMVLIYLTYSVGAFDNNICKAVLSFATKCRNTKYRYWLTQNVSKFCFFSQDGFYDDYYIDRKKLVKQCAQEMNISVPLKSENKNRNKICIINYLQSNNPLNSVQRVSTMIANGLNQYYDEIMILVLDCFIIGKKDEHNWGAVFHYKSAYSKIQIIKKMYPFNTKIIFCSGENYIERFQFAINSIYAFSPNAIIDLSDEYSLISYFYSKDFFTVNIPLRVGTSSLFFNSIVADSWIISSLNDKYRFINDEIVKDWSFPEYYHEEKIQLTRKDYNLPDDAFVILTLGKCSNACSTDFINEVCNYLINNHHSIWLVVGDTLPIQSNEQFLNLVKNNRIIFKEYENKIGSLCSICDVLLRVNVTGGSGSTAIAAMNGLPIAMTDFLCDPMRWLGRDFSSNHNYTDLFNYIHKLQNDKFFYSEKSAESKKLAIIATDAEKKWFELAVFLHNKTK